MCIYTYSTKCVYILTYIYGTKCAPTYACIYMDEVETEFLKTQERTALVWFRYIDDIFFIWTHGKEHLETFLQELNNFNPDLKFTCE